MEYSALKELSKLGYVIQNPSLKDNTYYMVRHQTNKTRQIYIKCKPKAKHAIVECLTNFKPDSLTKVELKLIEQFIFEELDYSTYEFKK